MISINKTSISIQIIAVLLAFFALGCSRKNIPAGDALYTGASLELQGSASSNREKKIIKNDLEHLLRPSPNSKFLGIRFKLGFYNMAGSGNNFVSKFLRKIGEPPVLMSFAKKCDPSSV